MIFYPAPDHQFYLKWMSLGAGFLFLTLPLLATNDNYQAGARPGALGNASVTLTDSWSSFNNQAGLGYLKRPTFNVFFENRYLVREYAYQAGSFTFPTKPGTLGVSFSYFGFSMYHESKTGLGFGRRFTKRFAAGVQVNYLQTYIGGGYTSSNALAAEIGLIAEPTNQLFIGFHVFNPGGIKFRSGPQAYIPTVFRLGAGLHFNTKALFLFETEKNIDLDPVFKGGIEVTAVEKLTLRVGITSDSNEYSFGLGYKYQHLRFDLAFSQHPILGMSPQASVEYEL